MQHEVDCNCMEIHKVVEPMLLHFEIGDGRYIMDDNLLVKKTQLTCGRYV